MEGLSPWKFWLMEEPYNCDFDCERMCVITQHIYARFASEIGTFQMCECSLGHPPPATPVSLPFMGRVSQCCLFQDAYRCWSQTVHCVTGNVIPMHYNANCSLNEKLLPIGSCIWILDHKLVMLLWAVMEPIGSGDSCWRKYVTGGRFWGLKASSIFFSLSLLLVKMKIWSVYLNRCWKKSCTKSNTLSW